MMNYGYRQNFSSPQARLFQMPLYQNPPRALQPIRAPPFFPQTSNAFQIVQQQQQQQQTSTTTTTTTTTPRNGYPPTQQELFPAETTKVHPLADSDSKNPNKTFEVLTDISQPKSIIPLSIPTRLVALVNSTEPPKEILTVDGLEPTSAIKYAGRPNNYEGGRDSDLFGYVSETQGLLINEMKVYNGAPIVRWLFLVCGLALLGLGILTALCCRPSDQLFYCRIWAAIALLAFGIVGFIHRGDYIDKCKNLTFTIFGLVTSVMTLACLYYLMRIFIHRIIEISQFDNWLAYLDEVRWRMAYLNDTPIKNLSATNQPYPGDNEITCLIVDGIEMIVDLSSFVIVISTTLVVDKFYSSSHVVTLKVRPFNHPRLFNPYGQVIVGEVQIFMGFLLQCIIYGNQNMSWQNILAPVFSGVVPIIAGICSGLTLKSCGINSKVWDFLSIIMQIVAFIINIVAVILITTGLVENVRTFNSGTMTQTTFSRNFMIFSCFAFSLADVVCLISLCYGVSVTVRLLICICCPESISTVTFPLEREGSSGGPNAPWDDPDEQTGYREVKRMLLKRPDQTGPAQNE